MGVVTPFDPWRSPLCTCPAKYVIHPYTGCGHRCLYCYATSYIRDHGRPRPKEDLLRRLTRDLRRVPQGALIEMSTSSDPYTSPEESLGLTRSVIREVLSRGYTLLITTKSTLVLRDLDILIRHLGRVVVAITITTLDRGIASLLEPGAPPPDERLRAVRALSRAGIPVAVRVDPIVPYVNDDPDGVERLVKAVAEAGALQVTSSTYKARYDSLARITRSFPEVGGRLVELYRGGERVGGYMYLRRDLRLSYMRTVKEAAERFGLAFQTCREGFPELGTPGYSCDGSSLARVLRRS